MAFYDLEEEEFENLLAYHDYMLERTDRLIEDTDRMFREMSHRQLEELEDSDFSDEDEDLEDDFSDEDKGFQGLEQRKFAEKEFECCICCEKVLGDIQVDLSKLPCSHMFHTACILKWLNRNPTCPLCRFKLQH